MKDVSARQREYAGLQPLVVCEQFCQCLVAAASGQSMRQLSELANVVLC